MQYVKRIEASMKAILATLYLSNLKVFFPNFILKSSATKIFIETFVGFDCLFHNYYF